MKKLFLIAAFFSVIACNKNGSESKESSQANESGVSTANDGQNIDPGVINNSESAKPSNSRVKEPEFKFEEEEWDFGTVTEGAKVSHTFRFKNVGNAPLIIQSATASCGCTIPKYSKDPIAPGEEGKIPVEFDSKGKESQITKDINIIANTNPVQKIIRIKVNVIPKK